MISSVAENRKWHMQQQYEYAKRARKLYHILGRPMIENFKALLKMNAIKNCPVTIEDVTIAQRIFGPDVSTLKGKSVRRPAKPVRDDLVEIPAEIK